MLEIIINKEPNKKSIMLLENGILEEKHEEHHNRQRLEGNIYCGKVQNVLEGMQSAFVDIGDTRNTFIRLKDLLPKQDESKVDGQYYSLYICFLIMYFKVNFLDSLITHKISLRCCFVAVYASCIL